MPAQMSLPGLDAPSAWFEPERVDRPTGPLRGYNLFLAICPQPEDARRIAEVAAELHRRHGLQGPCLQARNLHVSLHAVAAFPSPLPVPMSVIEAARAAAGSVERPPPFSIVFDRVCSFGDHSGPRKRATVLHCDDASSAAVAGLRQALTPALRRSGLQPQPSQTPHMTLLYDRGGIPEQAIEPVTWPATRFTLVLSHQGLGHHEWLGHWPLA